jgi:hypothetical protein
MARRRRRPDLVKLFTSALCQGRKVLTHAELARKISRRKLNAAVRAGKIRCGVSGCWLPEKPDPGAVAVMCRAIRSKKYGDYDLGRRR